MTAVLAALNKASTPAERGCCMTRTGAQRCFTGSGDPQVAAGKEHASRAVLALRERHV